MVALPAAPIRAGIGRAKEASDQGRAGREVLRLIKTDLEVEVIIDVSQLQYGRIWTSQPKWYPLG